MIISDAVWARLSFVAGRHGTSVSHLIRSAVLSLLVSEAQSDPLTAVAFKVLASDGEPERSEGEPYVSPVEVPA